MKRLLFILAAGLIAVTAQADNHKKSADASVTIVASETDADATHVYLSQDDSTDSGMTKMTYDENPKAFAQGWRDGWKSASKQSDLSSDQPAENMEKKLYGDITMSRGKLKPSVSSTLCLSFVTEESQPLTIMFLVRSRKPTERGE